MSRKVLHTICGLGLLFTLVVFAPAARASDWDQATQLTFNRPVDIPGHVALGAGTYWFTVPQGINAPNVVHIFNADRTKLIATVETIPTIAPKDTDDTELTFAEQSQRQPMALISWFYPGRAAGHEFLYSPREEARLSENEQITVIAQPASLVQAG
jgi:hypothetical protein